MTIKCSNCNSLFVHKTDNQQLKKIGVSKKYAQFIYTCMTCQKNFSVKVIKDLADGEEDDYAKSNIYTS